MGVFVREPIKRFPVEARVLVREPVLTLKRFLVVAVPVREPVSTLRGSWVPAVLVCYHNHNALVVAVTEYRLGNQ